MKHFFYSTLILLLLIGCSSTQKPAQPSNDAQNVLQEVPNQESTEHTGEKQWIPLYENGELNCWSAPANGTDGKTEFQSDKIIIGRAETMNGIRYEKEFPNNNYEIRYEARKTEGYDFFAACTFPVKDRFCTFINGGWGGMVVGLSSINGYSADENETTSSYEFKDNVWYRFRIRVADEQIRVWITPQNETVGWDEEELAVDFETDESKELSVRFEMETYEPLGFCTWSSEGELRNIEYRNTND